MPTSRSQHLTLMICEKIEMYEDCTRLLPSSYERLVEPVAASRAQERVPPYNQQWKLANVQHMRFAILSSHCSCIISWDHNNKLLASSTVLFDIS